MKVFVTGACGQLGHDILIEMVGRGVGGFASGRSSCCSDMKKLLSENLITYVSLDITNEAMVYDVIKKAAPDVVIHCAAWTAVDAAEDSENFDLVYSINNIGTRNIAKACKKIGCKMIYISTDYVFDGSGDKPWDPDCKDYNPLNVYGKSKLEGEIAVSEVMDKYFIIRISWVFGLYGDNFVKTMIKAGNKFNEVKVVNDQIGTPTYTADLAKLLIDIAATEKYGYYNVTNEGGYISWYDFCCEIYRQSGMKTKVIPVSTEEYGYSKAKRPLNSRLDKRKIQDCGFTPLPDWRDALCRFLKDLKDKKQ